MNKLTRRELGLLIAAGAFSHRAMSAEAPVVLPGVVGLAEAQAGLGKPLGREVAQAAVARAVQVAAGQESAAAAAVRLFRPEDTVGIKVNCLAGRNLSPRVELVEALVDLIAGAGVDRRRIIVFERSSRELRRAGFSIRDQGPPYRCIGTDNDYDSGPSDSGSIGSCFAKLVSTECTALVSFGVVKDHDLSGVSAGMKNWYGVIHNPNKYHDNNCDPYVADILRHPFLAGKLRLTVLDGVQAQCQGGPAFYGPGLFPLGKVAASVDPVAADLWAWRVIDEERVRRGMPTLEEDDRLPKFIATAERHGLGIGDPAKLRTVAT